MLITHCSPDKDTQQADLVPEDNPLSRLQAPAFGKREVFGVEAVLECVGVAGLAAAFSFCRFFGWNDRVWKSGHYSKILSL